ncbi:MAG: hypothetical protein Hyperionvirus3_52 [Hyperionvirus sp.]|uniref:C2H2-type domain-containing protein n=1 Tax=Hyperionvirus sp. TaxID=2487770 RepID=A0A3G5A6M1_9VIRU|nr:MAG: hypothetical protein Hyperionvirus3_52 [Hyperionvirus sp.]
MRELAHDMDKHDVPQRFSFVTFGHYPKLCNFNVDQSVIQKEPEKSIWDFKYDIHETAFYDGIAEAIKTTKYRHRLDDTTFIPVTVGNDTISATTLNQLFSLIKEKKWLKYIYIYSIYMYICSCCIFKTNNKTKYARHLDSIRHKKKIAGEVKMEYYQCDKCRYTCVNNSNFHKHMKIHTGKPYECPQCLMTFRDKGHFYVHLSSKIHTMPGDMEDWSMSRLLK